MLCLKKIEIIIVRIVHLWTYLLLYVGHFIHAPIEQSMEWF